ncbi:MAG TPA: hypothetical protein VFO85_05190, partial [Vicinamibacteria bacterium]|nr:hypothetical protein [Vicinamibacteria bacterium]
MGAADQAQQWGQDELAQAQSGGPTPTLASAHLGAAILAQHRRDLGATQASAEAVLALALAQDLEHRVAQGRLLRGWALAMQGDVATSVPQMEQGWEAMQRTGLQLYRPYVLALLAEAYGQAGQPEAGLTCLAEAVTRVAATEERWWEAEVYRLQGVLRLQRSPADVDQAAACFQQALDVARRQQAKSLELRAATSRARLWHRQGKRTEARELL